MSYDEKTLWFKIIAFFGGFIFFFLSLRILWAREQVKKDLQLQGFPPISIRWRPFAYWASGGTGFVATFVDAANCIQTARCYVWYNTVRWISDGEKYLNKNLSPFGRLADLIIGLLLLYFGIAHLFTGELVLHSRGRHEPIYLHGLPLILMSLAALSGAISLMIGIIYCYQVRANERHYTFISRALSVFGWILLWLSVGVYCYESFQNPERFGFPNTDPS